MFKKFFSAVGKILPPGSLTKHLVKVLLAKINIAYRKDLRRHIRIRESYSLFDVEKLSQPFKKPNDELVPVNTFYGISTNLKKYCGYNGLIYAAIEHGVRFGGSLGTSETVGNPTSAIITFGEVRHNYLSKKTDKYIYPIGPYIHYAEPFVSDKKFEEIKNELGKTLLVFPSHSMDYVEAKFDNFEFIEFIKRKDKLFDSVVVCMYWKDILLDKHQAYKKEGYRIATAGHRNDPNFLSRLKSLILLSDMTLSNDIGTHIGYCVYLNKPHYIYGQDIAREGKTENSLTNAFGIRGEDYQQIFKQEKEEIFNACSSFDCKVKKQQIDVCNKYWGFENVKNPEELYNILESAKADTLNGYLSIKS